MAKIDSNQVALSVLGRHGEHVPWEDIVNPIRQHAMDFAVWVSKQGRTNKTVDTLYKEFDNKTEVIKDGAESQG